MQSKIKQLPKSEVEITIEVAADELLPFMQKAAQHLSEHRPIEGFRPGHAPYEIVKAHFGEHAILEAASEDIVRKNYFKVIKENNLETISEPRIEITKMAADNPFEFKALAAVLPEAHLGHYKDLGVKKEETKITENKVDKMIEDLAKEQSKEVIALRPAAASDKVLIDMEMTKDGVPIEGGAAKDMAVYLAEKHYIPGFNQELIGLKKNDEKNFSLNFPVGHYQKHLAGAAVDFKVKVKDVYQIERPEINDELAKSLGQKTLVDLKALLRKNMESEAAEKDEEKWEIALLNKILENSRFGDMPEILVNEEVNKMLEELKHNLEYQNASFDDYLKSIKKTENELKLDFTPEAVRRIKAALAIRAIIRAENIKVEEEEIAEEITKLMNAYKDSAEAQRQIREPAFADYSRHRLENKKTMERVKLLNK